MAVAVEWNIWLRSVHLKHSILKCELKENIMATTQATRVLNALKTGEALTVKQMAARFGIANPTAVVTNLRQNGFPIYLNKSTNSKGETKGFYRLGTPSRAVIAAGYKALAAV
jgi:hypothetical protein